MIRTTDVAYTNLIAESAELEKKVEHLEDYLIKARKCEIRDITLPEIHQLEEQAHYMRGYLRCLKSRIASINGF